MIKSFFSGANNGETTSAPVTTNGYLVSLSEAIEKSSFSFICTNGRRTKYGTMSQNINLKSFIGKTSGGVYSLNVIADPSQVKKTVAVELYKNTFGQLSGERILFFLIPLDIWDDVRGDVIQVVYNLLDYAITNDYEVELAY